MRAFNHSRLFFLLIFLTFSLSYADERYTISAPQQFYVYYQVEIKNSGGTANDLKLQIPIFSTNGLPPYQRLVSFKAPSGVKIIRDDDGEIAVSNLIRLEKGNSLLAKFSFTFVNYAIDYQLKPYRGQSSAEPRYINPEPGIESDAGLVNNLAQKLTSGCNTQLEKAKKIFYYINKTLEYQKTEQDMHSALETLKLGKGVCEDFSLAYIALCRASGIPARLVRGYRFNVSELNSGETDLKKFAHAWVEVKLPAEGWITVEPTFTYTLNGIKTVNYDFFGKIDQSDRHLFFSYLRDIAPNCSWTHDPRNPADLTIKFQAVLRK
ncbi:MAG: transglutaminase-like domain-containing protein [Bacteroidota bacterium]